MQQIKTQSMQNQTQDHLKAFINDQPIQHTHHHHHKQPLSHSKPRRYHRKGGLSSVPMSAIIRYFQHLRLVRSNTLSADLDWLPSIKQFSKIINNDPILRMNWQYGIYQCHNTLPDKTGKDVLDMIDTAIKTPPAFSNSDLVGFPVNSIFIEFMQNQNGRCFFSNKRVNEALKAILSDYGKMLQTKHSLLYMNEQSPHGWFCQQAQKLVDYSLYICDNKAAHYNFKNWNEWFLRKFTANERQIGQNSPNGIDETDIIVNSCESTPLLAPTQPSSNVQLIDTFWLKDNLYSLVDMFGAERYGKLELAKSFQGGTVYQAFLSALFYHRWHAPVDGIIEDIYAIDGTYFLDQSQFIPYDQGSPNNSQSFLTAVAARKVIVIKADNPKIGKIAIIFIGMAEVSSCIATVKIGEHVKKGSQLGHFAYGGSSHAVVFQKQAKLTFTPNLYMTSQLGEVTAVRQNLNSYLATVEVKEQ